MKDPPPGELIRPGILTWKRFNQRYGGYFECEPEDIKKMVRGNCDYYSTGVMPACVPTIARRPPAVVAETTTGLTVPIVPREAKKS